MLSGLQLADAILQARDDRLALGQLLAHYQPYLQVFAESSIGPRIRRREDASDVVQRTMMEAAEAIPNFRGQTEPEFSAWIHQILRRNVANVVRDHRAAKRDVRQERYPDDAESSAVITWFQPAAHQTTASLRVIRAEAALNLAAALQSLPEDQRSAVRMRHLEGCSLASIAETLGKTPAAVAGLLRRGVQALRTVVRE